jgi:tape measure domain-containing protein
MAKTVYIGVSLDTKQLVTSTSIAETTLKRFESIVKDASGEVKKSSVPALEAYSRASINAEKSLRLVTSAIVPVKVAKAELTRTTKALEVALKAEVSTEAAMVAQAKIISEKTKEKAAAQRLYDQSLKDSGKAINTHAFNLKSLSGTLLGLGAGYLSLQTAISFGKNIIEVSDKYTLLEGRLKLVTKSTAELASVQASLYQISQRTRTDLSATADLYTQMARSSDQLGLSTNQILSITESVNKALIVSGASAESAQAALIQLGQGMASGTLRGEELNSVMEQTPRLAKMIADGLGITIGQLRQYGKDGKLSAEAVTEALLNQAKVIDEEFQQMGTTIGQAMIELNNAYESVIADANKASGGTDTVSFAIENLAKTIDSNKGEIVAGLNEIAKAAINMANGVVSAFADFGRLSVFKKAVDSGELIYDWRVMQFKTPEGKVVVPSGNSGKEWLDARSATNLANSYSADDNAAILSAYNADPYRGTSAKQGSYKAAAGSRSGGGGGNSALDRAQAKEAKEREALAGNIKSAQEWYAKEFESIKGQYEATKDATTALVNLGILLREAYITQSQYSDALAATSQKYHEALFSGHGDTSAFNLGIYGSASKTAAKSFDEKLSDQIGVLSDIGDMMDRTGIRIAGWDSLTKSYESLSKYFSTESQLQGSAKTGALITGITSAVSGIGQTIGGSTGAAISNIASMAGAGFAIGGPIGGVVGGVVGLVSSLFGGGSSEEDKQNQQNAMSMSTQSANAIVELANSGNSMAQEILRRSGYSASSLAGNINGAGTPTTAFYGMGIDSYLQGNIQNLALFYTKENNYNQSLLEYIDSIGQIDEAIKSFASTSVLSTLDQISWKYESITAKVTDLADLQQAKLAEQVMAITGLSADTISEMISSSIASAGSAKDAGIAFAEKLEESIVAAIRNMTISQVVTQSVMPYITPVINEITAGLLSGGITPAKMQELMAQVSGVAANIAPVVAQLYNAFDAGGVSYDYSYSGAAATSAQSVSYLPSSNATSGTPINVTVQIGDEVLEARIADVADGVRVYADRVNGQVGTLYS